MSIPRRDWAAGALAAAVLTGHALGAQDTMSEKRALRGMTVEDVLSLEGLGAIEISPRGDLAAVAILRSKRDGGFYFRSRLGGDDRGDLWIVTLATGAAQRITNGQLD